MPTLEGSLRAAHRIGLSNETTIKAQHAVDEMRRAASALKASFSTNDEKVLAEAMLAAQRAGLSSSIVEEGHRRLEGLRLAAQRLANIEQARADREKLQKTAPQAGNSKVVINEAMVSSRTKRGGLREAQVPLMSLVRTPLERVEA